MKSDNPPDNPPDRPPERRWPWSASARLPPSTTLGATFKQGRTRSRCHLDYFGNGTARRRNTAVTVRKGMGGGSRTEVAVRRFAPYPASSTRSAPPLCVAWEGKMGCAAAATAAASAASAAAAAASAASAGAAAVAAAAASAARPAPNLQEEKKRNCPRALFFALPPLCSLLSALSLQAHLQRVLDRDGGLHDRYLDHAGHGADGSVHERRGLLLLMIGRGGRSRRWRR